jgi:hypothetical protein
MLFRSSQTARDSRRIDGKQRRKEEMCEGLRRLRIRAPCIDGLFVSYAGGITSEPVVAIHVSNMCVMLCDAPSPHPAYSALETLSRNSCIFASRKTPTAQLQYRAAII